MEQWSKAELGILVHMWSCLLSPLCLPGQVLSLVFPVSWHPEPHIVYSSLSLLSESGCSLLRMVTRSLGGRQRCCILLQPFALSGDLSTSSRRVKAEHTLPVVPQQGRAAARTVSWQCYNAFPGYLVMEASCPPPSRCQVYPGTEAKIK